MMNEEGIFFQRGFTGHEHFEQVGNGALSGFATGGLSAALNGENIIKGAFMGAMIGGAVASVSYLVSELFQGGGHQCTTTDISTDIAKTSTDTSLEFSKNTIDNFVDNYGLVDIMKESKVSPINYSTEVPSGYGVAQDGHFYEKNIWQKLGFSKTIPAKGNVLGVTMKNNNIYLSRAAFANKSIFAEVMTHETGHVIINNSTLANIAKSSYGLNDKAKQFGDILDNWGHVAIRKMSMNLQSANSSWMNLEWVNAARRSINFMNIIRSSKSELDNLLQPLIKSFTY
jgi:hypothetical protein